jgi:DNA-binding MarR family transcriptional regulator
VSENRSDGLSEAFWSVARQLRHTSAETLAPWDISPSQARAIGVLRRHGVMRLSTLSEHLRVAPRSVTDVVDGLQARELIERLPDPEDRRATLARLTTQGERIAEAIQTARHAENERFFTRLSETERAHLDRILAKLRT